ncbi:zf-HC2 domain-containing protein [Trebonia sp.]|uniref:zf-HC2 domain-containing protein n=1 Tax=Trebonia sp. TaxID=2767075 RepID=UPI002625E67D|nr:zf-HC2 domain-containing protein [Trebonia sp.]
MTQAMDCSEARLSLGVYVLGAIDPAERALVDAHLASCRDCRDELAGLAGLPALLARVGKEEAIALAADDGPSAVDEEPPPRELLATVVDLTAARRRRRRWRDAGLGLAAALIIAAGVFGGLRATSAPAQPNQYAAGVAVGPWETATGQSQGMTVTVSYRPMGWGTQLEAKVSGIPIGTRCQMWVLGPGNSRVLAGSWVTDHSEGQVWYPASAAVNGNYVQAFVITVGATRSITVTA